MKIKINEKGIHNLKAQYFYGDKYKPYKIRKTICLNINHYLYLNMIKGNRSLSSLLRKLIVENKMDLLTNAIAKNIKLFEYVYSTPKTKTIKVSIGFKSERELSKFIKKQTLSEFVNKKLDLIYESQLNLNKKFKKELQ